MQRDDSVYLRHILDSVARIESYTSGLEGAQFSTNLLVQDAVIRQLEIIGEAAKRLSDDTRRMALDVPWADISPG